ncbi:MAG: DUF2783 domain-containing protein [Pikeienuella sp.]
MTTLNREPNLARVDDVYAAILEAHKGLSAEASAALNARLVLILANHIGDEGALREALALARETAPA